MANCSKILFFDELTSTNLYVKEHYQELDDNTLIIAGSQTAGRGRLGRKWISPPNSNIYATLVVKNIHDINLIGGIVGLAGLATLRELAPQVNFYIKWPNDIYVGKAKLAGILSESCEVKNGKIQVAACGIGININSTPDDLSSIDQSATSLLCETKTKFNLDFFKKRLAFFTNWYYITYLNNYSRFFSEWEKANRLIGQQLVLIDARGIRHEGVAVKINSDGGLVLREIKKNNKNLGESGVSIGIEKVHSKSLKVEQEAMNGISTCSLRGDNLQNVSFEEGAGGKYFNSFDETEENIYYCGDVSVDKSSIDFDKLY